MKNKQKEPIHMPNVTLEDFSKSNITLRDALKTSAQCKKAMERFGIHHISVIENTIAKMGIQPHQLFSMVQFRTSIKLHNGLYLIDNTYSMLTWKEVYYQLFKRYYPTLYNTFMKEEKNDIDLSQSVRKYIDSLPLLERDNMTIAQFLKKMNNIKPTKKVSMFKLYADYCPLFFLELNDKHSVYLRYNDLLLARQGNFLQAWLNICEEKVSFNKLSQGVTKQCEEPWFYTSKEVETLANLLKEISNK